MFEGSRDFGIGKRLVVEHFLEFDGKPTDSGSSSGFEQAGTNFWVPLMLEIVEVPAQFESAAAPDVAAADRRAVGFAIEKEGSAEVVATVVVGRGTSRLTDQFGAETAAWAEIDAPIRTAHLVEIQHPCRHGSIPAGVPADH